MRITKAVLTVELDGDDVQDTLALLVQLANGDTTASCEATGESMQEPEKQPAQEPAPTVTQTAPVAGGPERMARYMRTCTSLREFTAQASVSELMWLYKTLLGMPMPQTTSVAESVMDKLGFTDADKEAMLAWHRKHRPQRQ